MNIKDDTFFNPNPHRAADKSSLTGSSFRQCCLFVYLWFTEDY